MAYLSIITVLKYTVNQINFQKVMNIFLFFCENLYILHEINIFLFFLIAKYSNTTFCTATRYCKIAFIIQILIGEVSFLSIDIHRDFIYTNTTVKIFRYTMPTG